MQNVRFLLSSGCLELTVFRRPSVAVPSAVVGATPAAAAAAAAAAVPPRLELVHRWSAVAGAAAAAAADC